MTKCGDAIRAEARDWPGFEPIPNSERAAGFSPRGLPESRFWDRLLFTEACKLVPVIDPTIGQGTLRSYPQTSQMNTDTER